jgi:hypothetical protein
VMYATFLHGGEGDGAIPHDGGVGRRDRTDACGTLRVSPRPRGGRMPAHPDAGRPGAPDRRASTSAARRRLLQRRPRPRRAAPTRGVRHLGPPRPRRRGVVQRRARRRDRRGDRRAAPGGRGRGPPLPRRRHPRALRAGVPDGPRGAGGPRRRRRGRPRPGAAADAGRVVRDPPPRRHAAAVGGRHRHHPVAQPARGRGHQVQPAPRWTGRRRGDRRDRTTGERAPRGRRARGPAGRGGAPSPPPRPIGRT